MNFREQAENFMSEIAHRKSDPVKPNTLHVYRSILDVRILPVIGGKEMADVNNKTVKALVVRLTEDGLSPATITLAVSLVKQVMKSVVDDEGNQLYPRNWNTRFIDAPRVDPGSQKAPICATNALSEAISHTSGEWRALIALLGGTGLRINEALALSTVDDGISNLWDSHRGILLIRATLVDGQVQPSTKTKAGTRQVDLDPALNHFLRTTLGDVEGRVFAHSESAARRVIKALGIPGFHSMRRLRITHLQNESVPATLVKFWAGHASGDITERYTKVGSQVQERKDWSKRAGLGFSL